ISVLLQNAPRAIEVPLRGLDEDLVAGPHETPRPRALLPELVVGIDQRTLVERQTPAADAAGELVPEARDERDPAIEFITPLRRHLLPVSLGRLTPIGERGQSFGDSAQWNAELVGEPDDRQSPQHVAIVATLIAASAVATDQPLALVEVQRRYR